MESMKQTWLVHRHWWAALSVAIAVHWLAVESHHLFASDHHSGWREAGPLAIYAVLVLLAVQWLYHERLRFFGQARTRELRQQPAERRPHIILFLSQLRVGASDPPGGIPSWFLPTADLRADLDRLKELKQAGASQQWSWEMPLRALAHHAASLRSVSLVCSEESIPQLGWFGDIVRSYPLIAGAALQVLLDSGDGKIEVKPIEPHARIERGGWPFEDFDRLSQGMRRLLEHMLEHHHCREQEIMIDFTGGQKVASVVAASITFNRRIKAQYVSTTSLQPISFDIVMETSHETGLEL